LITYVKIEALCLTGIVETMLLTTAIFKKLTL